MPPIYIYGQKLNSACTIEPKKVKLVEIRTKVVIGNKPNRHPESWINNYFFNTDFTNPYFLKCLKLL